jgi:GT2 family glycosyltransferase
MTPVTVVVPTWNALAYTKECLTALREVTDHPDWRVVVVDNGSTDGTLGWLRDQAWLTVLAQPENLGYGRACNIGIAAARPGDDIVLLNNDVVVDDPGWLARLQDAAHADPSVGIAGARLLAGDGRLSHTGSHMLPVSLRGEQEGGQELDVGQCRRRREVEAVVFALVYLRRDTIEQVGVLDEAYFAYFEDSDYCLRVRRAGRTVVYAGDVSATHHGNVSTRENKVDFFPLFNRSRRTFRKRWAGWLDQGAYDQELVWHSVLNRAPGYALQSRTLMKALHFAGVRVAYRDAYEGERRETDDLLINDLLARPVGDDVAQVAFCQADVFEGVRGRPRAGWTMLEVDGLPREWVDGCNAMDEVWVPSTFNRETFVESGVRVPVHVMPLAVDVDYFNPGITGFRPSSRYTFLSVFEWGERKGAELLLQAYAEEFKPSDDVLLLLSVYNRDKAVDVRHEVAKLLPSASPPVVVMVNAEFAPHQMGALYRSADCFVLPTRGEGWGMPVLEAMACGLPAIATAWSAIPDFLTEETGYPLAVRSLVPAVARCPWYEGFRWAEPDVEHLRLLLRTVAEDPVEARRRGERAAAAVAAGYSLETVARRVKERVRGLV